MASSLLLRKRQQVTDKAHDSVYEKYYAKTKTTASAGSYTSSATYVLPDGTLLSGSSSRPSYTISETEDFDDTATSEEVDALPLSFEINDKIELACSLCGGPIDARIIATTTKYVDLVSVMVEAISKQCDCPAVRFVSLDDSAER